MGAQSRQEPPGLGAEPARFAEGLTMRRRIAGFAVAVVVGPLLTWLFSGLEPSAQIATEVLGFQLLVVVVALIGGIWPALFAAVLSALTLDLFFIEPHLTVAVADPVHAITLLLHILIAVLVGFVVARAERQTQRARRAAEIASRIEPLAASDRVRGALLSALSHDLRRPLAAATAAVGGLRTAGDALSEADARELLETAEESLDSLTVLVTDLLDVSRVQAGALTITPVPVDPNDVLAHALEEFGDETVAVELATGHGSGRLLADPVLLQRAVVNLLANAARFSPSGAAVQLSTRARGDRVEIRVVDHGPGIPVDRGEEIFAPFQRLGDTDNTTGLGLGLALSRGFIEAMRGTLVPEDTPGGGLTMVVSLPSIAQRAEDASR